MSSGRCFAIFRATFTRTDGLLPLPDHKNVNHLVDELNLRYLCHLLDSLDHWDLCVRHCPCGHWSRANNGRSWSPARDNRSSMSIRGLGCGLHVLRTKSGLHGLNTNWKIFQDWCCDEFGSSGFCRKTHSYLDRLNDFPVSLDRQVQCSNSQKFGRTGSHLGLWGLNSLLNDLQLCLLHELHLSNLLNVLDHGRLSLQSNGRVIHLVQELQL